jgi:hypothetical protein
MYRGDASAVRPFASMHEHIIVIGRGWFQLYERLGAVLELDELQDVVLGFSPSLCQRLSL